MYGSNKRVVRHVTSRIPGQRSSERERLSCGGTPDSDVLADYMDRFQYRPERRQEILDKYDRLFRAKRE